MYISACQRVSISGGNQRGQRANSVDLFCRCLLCLPSLPSSSPLLFFPFSLPFLSPLPLSTRLPLSFIPAGRRPDTPHRHHPRTATRYTQERNHNQHPDIMSFPSLVSGGAECGPSNPMNGLVKSFSRDRSLQQVALPLSLFSRSFCSPASTSLLLGLDCRCARFHPLPVSF